MITYTIYKLQDSSWSLFNTMSFDDEELLKEYLMDLQNQTGCLYQAEVPLYPRGTRVINI